MADTRFRQIPIGDRLILELFDCSRLLTGDRWKVVVEARMEVPVKRDVWEDDPISEFPLEAMEDLLGDTQIFIQRRERVFVAAEEKSDLVQSFATDIETDLVPYLKHPHFVKRFLEKQYREVKERSQWPTPDL
jgi:hypothetical protein